MISMVPFIRDGLLLHVGAARSGDHPHLLDRDLNKVKERIPERNGNDIIEDRKKGMSDQASQILSSSRTYP
jgi:hypothetical protein|uniref:Uncharacterized protein n=1 Tax=Picea glauca TaxID=3330 RepID=A0A117NHB8_PICGL|nr:hypothetical protein ABT39_MTgene5134 [Picea glauca]QHR86425.1 hypothetical protein Q903MT_gene424 [Picea sitchensis]